MSTDKWQWLMLKKLLINFCLLNYCSLAKVFFETDVRRFSFFQLKWGQCKLIWLAIDQNSRFFKEFTFKFDKSCFNFTHEKKACAKCYQQCQKNQQSQSKTVTLLFRASLSEFLYPFMAIWHLSEQKRITDLACNDAPPYGFFPVWDHP